MALNLTDNWQMAKILTDNWHLHPPIQTLVEISIDFEQESRSARNQGHDKRGEIWMSLIACGSIHEGHEWFGDYSRERRDFYVFGRSII